MKNIIFLCLMVILSGCSTAPEDRLRTYAGDVVGDSIFGYLFVKNRSEYSPVYLKFKYKMKKNHPYKTYVITINNTHISTIDGSIECRNNTPINLHSAGGIFFTDEKNYYSQSKNKWSGTPRLIYIDGYWFIDEDFTKKNKMSDIKKHISICLEKSKHVIAENKLKIENRKKTAYQENKDSRLQEKLNNDSWK